MRTVSFQDDSTRKRIKSKYLFSFVGSWCFWNFERQQVFACLDLVYIYTYSRWNLNSSQRSNSCDFIKKPPDYQKTTNVLHTLTSHLKFCLALGKNSQVQLTWMKRVPDLMLSLGRLFFWGWLCDDLAGQVKIQRMHQQIIAKVFGWGSVVHNFVKFPFMTGKSERSDIILGRQLIWCFECQGHGVFTHLCLRATAKKTKDDYVSKKERLEENCKKKTHDPETVVSK